MKISRFDGCSIPSCSDHVGLIQNPLKLSASDVKEYDSDVLLLSNLHKIPNGKTL